MKLPAADCLLHCQGQSGKVDGAQHFAGGPETQCSVHGLVPIINPDGMSQPAVSSGPHLRVGADETCVPGRISDVVAQRGLDRPGYEGWFPGLRISHVAFLQSLRDVLARLSCVGRQIPPSDTLTTPQNGNRDEDHAACVRKPGFRERARVPFRRFPPWSRRRNGPRGLSLRWPQG
jgi:hypothetical protein